MPCLWHLNRARAWGTPAAPYSLQALSDHPETPRSSRTRCSATPSVTTGEGCSQPSSETKDFWVTKTCLHWSSPETWTNIRATVLLSSVDNCANPRHLLFSQNNLSTKTTHADHFAAEICQFRRGQPKISARPLTSEFPQK